MTVRLWQTDALISPEHKNMTLLLGIAALGLLLGLVLLWLRSRQTRPGAGTLIVTLASLAAVVGLGYLAATGRLHWMAPVAAASLPFLRRAGGLTLRLLPLLARALSSFQGPRTRQSEAGPTGGAAPLSRADALKILGLSGNPSPDEIRAAHRRLMAHNHPDKGGSNYIAQQLNAAKQTLLG